MIRRSTGAAIAALALAACSILAPRDPDLTPLNPTAVLETHVISTGIPDIPAFERSTLTYTRATMQREETRVRDTGIISRFLGGKTLVRIERLDSKLAWTLDAKKEQAVQCPLKGCAGAGPIKPATRNSEDDKADDTGCRLRIANTKFTMEPTGQRRSINGFETEQYDVQWLVSLKDNASHKSTSRVSIDLWVARVTPALRDALALEKAFDRARDALLHIDVDAGQRGKLPPEVDRMISGYLARYVSPTDREDFLANAKRLDKINGQPVLMTVKWRFAGQACSMDETMKDIGDQPLFTFTSEVISHKMERLHDSLFAPPRKYKITK
jgi:hypothetical protein